MIRFRSETAAGLAGSGLEDFTDSLMTSYRRAESADRGESVGISAVITMTIPMSRNTARR
jgi:hypothetical protein